MRSDRNEPYHTVADPGVEKNRSSLAIDFGHLQRRNKREMLRNILHWSPLPNVLIAMAP